MMGERRVNNWQLGVIAALGLTIAMNAAANIVPFNGVTTGAVSNSIPSFFVPAAYVFSIWSVIYLLLVGFAAYQALPQQAAATHLVKVRQWFVVSCFANALWIVLWHYQWFASSVVVMVVLLVSLIMVYRELQQQTIRSRADWFFVHAPFNIYLAWISVATISNIAAALVVYDWNGFGLDAQVWTAAMTGVAVWLAVAMTALYRDYLFAAVILWALVGIAANFPAAHVIVSTLYISVPTIGLVALASLFLPGGVASPETTGRSPRHSG